MAYSWLVGEVGLEPTKAKPADLQSAPFAARDTPPNLASAWMRGSSRGYGEHVGRCQPRRIRLRRRRKCHRCLDLDAAARDARGLKDTPCAHAVHIPPPRSSPIAAAGSARPRAVRHSGARLARPATAR